MKATLFILFYIELYYLSIYLIVLLFRLSQIRLSCHDNYYGIVFRGCWKGANKKDILVYAIVESFLFMIESKI